MRKNWMLVALILLACSLTVHADPILKDSDYLAVCGDSITEQKQYSVFIEDYLMMCQPAKVRVSQFGWGGEHGPQFVDRMDFDCLQFKPTVVTSCYGMNDGGYGRTNPIVEKTFRDSMTAMVKKFKAGGVRTIVLGGPGVVDSTAFKRPNVTAEVYNKTLGRLSDIAAEVAKDQGVVYADVHGPMMDTMAKAKAKYGDKFILTGTDGVHPGPAGHLVMAYAFLKALGCDGNIGAITYNASTDEASCSGDQSFGSVKNGTMTIRSARYPFCFTGKADDLNSSASVLPFLPFNDDLNRFMLTVINAKAEKYNVTWGKDSKTFTADQLKTGVNLAAEFLDNPFCENFRAVEASIRKQQAMQTAAYKNVMDGLRQVFGSDLAGSADIAKKIQDKDIAMNNDATALFKPVTHTIKIEEAK